MENNKYLEMIEEEVIKEKIRHFIGYQNEINYYKKVADIIFDNNIELNHELFNILDISGSVLFYGLPGVGKTSLAYCLADYVLKKYEVESYKIQVSNLIESQLGKTTKNISNLVSEIISTSDRYGALIILDEIDRISIVRNNENELSEMKRALIEFMDFLDNVKHTNNLMIIGITNFVETLDEGLRRRFDFQQEIIPTFESIYQAVELLNNVLELNFTPQENKVIANVFFEGEMKNRTVDFVKKYYKKNFIECIESFGFNKELFKSKLSELIK